MNKSFFIIAGSLSLLLSASIFWAITKNSKQDTTINKPTKNISSVAELTSETAPLTIKNIPGVLIVDFYAEWCGPCKTLKPIFDEVADEFKESYSFARANIDQCKELAEQYQITSIPTIVIFSGGKVLDTITGLMPKETLLERIEQALNGPQDLSTLSQEALDNKLMQSIQGVCTLDEIKRILDGGANVNHAGANGITPLLMAIIVNGSRGMDPSELVTLLLSHGASTEFVDVQTGTKTSVSDFVQMMSQNCKRMAENYDKASQALHDFQTKSKKCTDGVCHI